MVGTLPYLATSLSTVYLTWNLSTEWPASSKLVNSLHLSHETAEQWLHLMEPLQLGYGAVIISFLGAIHWVRSSVAYLTPQATSRSARGK